MLRTDLWVSAFVRRRNHLGEICVISRSGDPVAGQIFIEIDHLNGRCSLLSPAPAASRGVDDEDRIFVRRLASADPPVVAERLKREVDFDSDLWVISLQTRAADIGV